MIRVGITGIDGLIGWHLAAFLHGVEEAEVVGADRETIESPERLAAFAGQCDAIVHLAGMNRGDDDEIRSTNVTLTQAVVDACVATAATPHLLFASSTHIFRETVYGESKRLSSKVLEHWAVRHGAIFTNLVLPNVFGEGGRPFYNSVVHTFCHQLAQGETPTVSDPTVSMPLLHAQDVAELIYAAAVLTHPGHDGRGGQADHGGNTRQLQPPGTPLTVGDLLARLQEFADLYIEQGIIPNLERPIDRDLFNTFRSYLYPEHYPVAPDLHTDDRGTLFEAVKTPGAAQVFLSTTYPGITRGNHYHRRKVERFLVVEGEAVIRIRKLLADEVIDFVVGGDRPRYVDIPTLHTHNITNTGGDKLTTLFWAHELYDPEASDTIYEEV